MTPQSKGCFRFFQVAGITVFVHWSWFLVAMFEIFSDEKLKRYPSVAWNVAEYLALFGIVLMHEFGHALACRQVGGTAERIVLWPLGGVAFVNPPPRPGALLWSIVAGPLVNVALLPVTLGFFWLAQAQATAQVQQFCFYLALINFVLLAFNLLPVYPLDGGQILQALLWFIVGRWRSLMVVSVLGLLGAGGLLALAAFAQNAWLGILAVFVGMRAVRGMAEARLLLRFQPGLDALEEANSLVRRGAYAEAMAACDHALEVLPAGHPLTASAHSGRGFGFLKLGEVDRALEAFDEAVRLRPTNAADYVNRGLALVRAGNYEQAIADYKHALKLDPHLSSALNNLAWLWATCPDAAFRDGAAAVDCATRACQLSGGKEPTHLGTLAAAYAEAGDYPSAVSWQEKALADPRYAEIQGARAHERVRLYEHGQPYREQPTSM